MAVSVETVVEEYAAGDSILVIAKRHQVSYSAVQRRLEKANVPRRGPVRVYPNLPIEDIVRDYLAGDSLLGLAGRHGVANSTIRRLLLRAGTPMRKTGERGPIVDAVQAPRTAAFQAIADASVVLSGHEIDQLRRVVGWQPHWVDDYDYVNGD